MKKIGILTFHRAHNYGAVLQCYALQEILKGLGYDVQVIDYRQPHIERVYAPFSIRSFIYMLRHPRGMYRYIKLLPRRITKKHIFNDFVSNCIRLSDKCTRQTITQDIDTYIIGSDQLWGLHCTGGEKDPVFFGNFNHKESSSIIGYAISTNQKSIDVIGTNDLKKYASNFSTLSFREALISSAVLKMTGVSSRVDIDPTLLTNPQIWEAMINDKWANEKYVLLYQVRYPFEDADLLNRKATELALQLDCKVIDLSSMKYSVEDFVSLFKYAQYVITSSFHASVFSVIFERPLFAVKLKDGKDGRYENILNAIGAESLLVDKDFTPTPKFVDYSPIKMKLQNLQKLSLDYLAKEI